MNEWMNLTSALALCTCCSPNTLWGEPWRVLRLMQGHLSRPSSREVCGLQVSSAGHVLLRLREHNTHTWERHSAGLWAFYHSLLHNRLCKEHVSLSGTKGGGEEKCSVEQQNMKKCWDLLQAESLPVLCRSPALLKRHRSWNTGQFVMDYKAKNDQILPFFFWWKQKNIFEQCW